jgi:integrase
LQQDNWVGEIGQGFTTVTVVVQQPPVKHEVKMKDFVTWLGRQGRSPSRGHPEARAGENIGQSKPREDVTEKAKETNQQEDISEFSLTRIADSLRSWRNRALLALLVGCGLRRAEVTPSRLEDFQRREGHWVIADLIGKGGHIRTIPVPDWVKAAADGWTRAAGISTGPLLRSINKARGIWGDGFTPKLI